MTGSSLYNTFKLITVLTFIFFSFGCTHYYVPKQYPATEGMVPDFTSNNAVAIINAQSPGKVELIGSQGFHKWMGDLRLWTDTAIGVLENELQIRKVSVTGDATKELKLSVTHASVFFGFATIRCVLSLKVDTGEGYSREFEGNNSSPWTLYRACDGAVTRAVEAMLNDEEILSYIKY